VTIVNPRPLLFLLALASAVTVPACIEASQRPVAYEARAVSRGNGTAVVGEWTITLSRADVALGPFYFCAATSGSATLCASSVAELAHVSVVSALAPIPTRLGTVRGFTGPIRSASYDFGISWFDTQIAPTPAPALPGGHSIHLEGEARKGAVHFPFVADVDVVPQRQGQNAVSTSPAAADVISDATRLEIVLEPAAWLRQVDLDDIAARVAATGQTPFVIAPGSPEHGALLVGLKNLAPLELRWVDATNP
jgi:hypothetical protein